ncbi:MAG: CopG family transcriptional regulator, partial [Candidatus Hydrogenedentes bacterium]|nr:CopG family transcriptional regulator [Candidatus Hydrogenedentota bacterium]
EQFKQEAMASWTEYQETGQYLTGQETRDWLNTWGTDKETSVPECHE